MNNSIRNFYDEIINAKISLNETEFLAYIIGKRITVNNLFNDLHTNILNDIIAEIDMIIIQAKAVSMQALEKKRHIPIKNALGLFFHFDKDKAMVMFQSVIREDFNDTLDRVKDMEHLLYLERFFSRLNLAYIPKLSGDSYKFQSEENLNNFVTYKYLKSQLDDYGIFSFTDKSFINRNNPSPINVKYLLKDKFIKILITFFDYFDLTCKEKHLDVLHNFLTSPHCGYKLFEINNSRDTLFQLIIHNNIKQEFNYLLCQEIPTIIGRDIKTNLIEGVSRFFISKDGYSFDSLKKYTRSGYNSNKFTYLQSEAMLNALEKLYN